MSPLAPAVTSLRANLLADPGLRDVAPAAADALAAAEDGFLGNLRAQLDRMKDESGGRKDHLVFVPHGPLHFYPLHLLGERPLADEWIVTYLPVLSMVAPRRGLPSLAQRPRQRAAVLGMGFDADPRPGLPPMPGSRREASAVAQILGTRALLDEDCTAGALLEGLSNSYWAHLSTHGRHNVAAPAFQSLYLTPDQHFPGRIEAHDVLGRDLRNLDLLTLSACETSLGRFDIRDNLRGLPASFLLAGVETVIGTLWPAEVNASERFFTTLYRLLADGRPKLDAFRSAQDATRAELPQFRDWGAFHYVGRW
jgi:CHAT domain-containing protein